MGVAAAILAFIEVVAENNTPASTTAATAAEPARATPTQKAKKPILVNAASLWAAYHDNEVAADDRYKGKRFAVQGQVEGINKDNLNPANDSGTDEAYVSFFTMVDYEPAKAYIRSDSLAQAARLQIDQVVTVDCYGAGMVGGSPVLNDCSISPDNSTAEPAKPTQDNAPQTPQVTDSQAAQTPVVISGHNLYGCLVRQATFNHYTSTDDAAVMQLLTNCPDAFQKFYHACIADTGSTSAGCNLAGRIMSAQVLGILNHAQ